MLGSVQSVNVTSATTRAVRPIGDDLRESGERLFSPGDTVVSCESRLEYRIERLVGQGGFGQAYLARRLGRSGAVPQVVCIKASRHIDPWLREAYFGQLLDRHPRAISVYDVFPVMRGRQAIYCLALEYARF